MPIIYIIALFFAAHSFATTPFNYARPAKEELEVIAKSQTQEIVLGNISDRTGVTKFGHNNDVDTAATEIVRAYGGTSLPIMSAASTLSVVSSDTNDTNSSGTGLRQIIIYGINGDYEEVTEILNLNGTGAVTTTNAYRGVNRASAYLSGTGRKNAGTITLTHTTDNQTIATIPVGSSTTQQPIYYMPANKIAYLQQIRLSSAKPTAGSEPETTFSVKVYSTVTNSIYEISRVIIPAGGDPYLVPNYKLEPLQAKEIIWVEATTTQNDTQVAARFSLILANTTLP